MLVPLTRACLLPEAFSMDFAQFPVSVLHGLIFGFGFANYYATKN